MNFSLHVVSHTHWDREWYMPFEAHRLRLVALLDMLLDTFDRDPAFKHFHMDGQMIPLEDYLAVRPDREAAVRRACAEGKLSLGPWYVLQDEFLTSGEANVRNLMHGLRLARRFGQPMMVGYLPDAFGNISQMPQILRGFGIDSAVFGRGVNRWAPRGADNPVCPGVEGYKSELVWRSPDGSEVLGVFMANWYSNAMDIPSDPQAAAEFLARARDNAAAVATTSQLLLMNGCDHTPTRQDVGQVIAACRDLLPDEVLHTSLADYIAAVKREVRALQVAEGELRSEYTDGWGTLADTLSSRLYQKRANYRCQNLLEKLAEPLTAIAWQLGNPHPTDQLRYAWATLMQNHPHDSICGCSCDEVHREIDVRFEKAETVASSLRDDAVQAIGDRVDNEFVSEGAATVLVLNPLGVARSGVVDVEVQVPADAPTHVAQVCDAEGNLLPVLATLTPRAWDYKLPDDRFRTPYQCKTVSCRIAVHQVPAMGYKSLAVHFGGQTEHLPRLIDSGVLENEHLRVDIGRFGLLRVEDKHSGAAFEGLNLFEDGGDCGDEYIYRAPTEDRVFTTGTEHTWELFACAESPPGSWAIVNNRLGVPECCVGRERRSSDSGSLQLATHLFLARDARHLEVRVTINNQAKDHRLRALFPTDIEADVCYADGQFDILERRIVPWEGWKNPSNPQPQQAFVDISDGKRGLCIGNRGLPCYEVLRDGRNTIALTLLRCVGQLGDWGVFPTPEAQCLGEHVAEYAIIPHAGHIMDPENCDAARIAYEYANPLWATQIKHFMHPHKERWQSALPPQASFLGIEPSWLVLSAVKKAEERDSLIARVYNPFRTDVRARLTSMWAIGEAYLTNLAEERLEAIAVEADGVSFEAAAKKIVTVELVA